MSNLKDSANAIAQALDDICAGLKKPIYDDTDMDAHAQSVEILKKFQHQLKETIDKEEKYIAEYITTQEEFIKRLKNRFSRVDHTQDKKFESTQDNKQEIKSESIHECNRDSNQAADDDGWSIVARRRKIQNNIPIKSKSKLLGSAIGQKPLTSMIPTTVHELAPNVLIPSKSIKTPEECHDNPGVLCWDHSSRKFWFSLNGYAISFSMGNVWWTPQDLKRPIKTTEFDPEKYCRPEDKLNYYFPPEVEYNIPHPMSDQRNFTGIATFCPTSVEPDHPSLRISDRNTLREDIVRAKPSDIRYAADYHAHGLGALIAMHHLKSC